MPLKFLFEKLALSKRLLRWLILLAEFDFKYVARKTIKGSVVSNFCAENPIEGADGKEDFPNEDILDVELGTCKMYFDEAVNQYVNGIRVLLITLKGSHIPLAIKLNIEATNNMVEFSLYCWGSSSRIGGKRVQSLWRFNFGYVLSTKIMVSNGRTFEALSTIPRRLNQDL